MSWWVTPARRLMAAVVLAYLVLGAGYVIRTPDWQAPDEPAHYHYVQELAENGCCPKIEMGSWDTAYLGLLTSSRFAPENLDRLDTVRYENHQPPLYYLLMTPIYAVTNGSLRAMRFASLLLGLGVVLSTYGVGRNLMPERPWVAVGAAALVGLLPQHLAILSSMNNDGLAGLVIGVSLLAITLHLRDGRMQPWVMGVLVGVGFLTKLSTLFLAGLMPLAILIRWRMEKASIGVLIQRTVLFTIPALVMGGVWWARNASVYGFPDIFGLRMHDMVVADQPRTADRIEALGWSAYLTEAFWTTFNSFWGQFGWMAAPLPGAAYRIIQGFMLMTVAGLGLAWRTRPPGLTEGWRRAMWSVLLLTAVLALLAFLYYNTEFLQYQGRYLYPGLIPAALWTAVGLEGWGNFIKGRFAAAPWLTAVIPLWLVLLNAFVIWRVLPGLLP